MFVSRKIKSLVIVASLGAAVSYPLSAVWASGSEHEGHSIKMKKSDRKEIPKNEKSSVAQVFKINEELHEAFFDYNSSKVESLSKKMASAIEALNSSEIKKLLTYSAGKLNDIKSSNGRDKNNKIYHMVSTALIHVLNTYEVSGSYNAYYCPMVKMNWIQNSRILAKTQNPYTPEMKMCGEKKTSF